MNLFNIFGSGGSRRKGKLSPEAESSLMLIISRAKDINDVQSEFSALYDNISSKLWGKLLKKFNNIIDLEDIEDAYQEGWRKVLENRKSYIEGSNVYNWIYTIIKNTASDISRKDKKTLNEVEFFSKSNVNVDKDDFEEENMLHIIPSEDKNIDEEISAREVVQVIHETIEMIEDETDRAIIKMRVIEGLKFGEIAKNLDMPIATVHYKVNQTMNKIKPRIKKLLDL